ncbi:hypothetical protein QE152_g1383 [Popillia japonica]|uniref:Uncharacterized protein n=1 Tax=Popillia japonica TaxID=7064 RepID=A0AAW1N4W9_POPJA
MFKQSRLRDVQKYTKNRNHLCRAKIKSYEELQGDTHSVTEVIVKDINLCIARGPKNLAVQLRYMECVLSN